MSEAYEKKQQRFFRLKTIDMLQNICGYTVSEIIKPKMKEIFDFSCDSPFSEREKDAGELVKVLVFKFIDKSALQVLRKFKTSKKKSLWIWTHPREVSIFKFEDEKLVSPRDESLLREFVKSDVKEKIKINLPLEERQPSKK